MWIKKTEQEIAEMKKRTIPKMIKSRKLSHAITVSIWFFVISFLYHKFGFSAWETKPKPWNEVLSLLPRLIAYSLIIFCASYLFLFNDDPIEKIFICLNCNNKKYNLKKNMQCKCGGEYVDMDLLKWVDDENSDKETENQQEQTPPNK